MVHSVTLIRNSRGRDVGFRPPPARTRFAAVSQATRDRL